MTYSELDKLSNEDLLKLEKQFDGDAQVLLKKARACRAIRNSRDGGMSFRMARDARIKARQTN